jgi:hypothetical protein
MMSKIILPFEVQVKLCAWAEMTGGLEFSGLGEVTREGSMFFIEDVTLLGVGSVNFTEFPYERASRLGPNIKRKLWFHRHPITGWSGTDEDTATKTPLGGVPEMIQWSLAIVLTPRGWIGRIDFHAPKKKTVHLPVEPKVFSPEVVEAAQDLKTEEALAYIRELKAEFEVSRGRTLKSRAARAYTTYADYDDEVYFDDVVDATYTCGCMVYDVPEDDLPDTCELHPDCEIEDWWYVDERKQRSPRPTKQPAWREAFNRIFFGER